MASRKRHVRSSPIHHPLIAHVSSFPARHAVSNTVYNEHTWQDPLGQGDRPAASTQTNSQGPKNGLIDMIPPTQESRALHPTRGTRAWRQRLGTLSAQPVPESSISRGPVSFNSIGVPTFSAREWRQEQRASSTPIIPSNTTEARNSERDQKDRKRMDLDQPLQRSFERWSGKRISFGLLGFASMQLGVWEQILLLLPLILPLGGFGTALAEFIVVAALYGSVTKSLADMVREYPTYAGPFYWTVAYQTPLTTLSLPHLLGWCCAWMSFLGLTINLAVNMTFITDVAIFIFTLASKHAKLMYSPKEPKDYLKVPWALPVIFGIAIAVALIPNLKTAKILPKLVTVFLFGHWLSFLLFVIAVPIICKKATGLSRTV